MYILASGITNPKRKRALLLYQADSRVREIFRSLPDTGPDEAYDTTKQRLKEYFDPQKNWRYEVIQLRQFWSMESLSLARVLWFKHPPILKAETCCRVYLWKSTQVKFHPQPAEWETRYCSKEIGIEDWVNYKDPKSHHKAKIWVIRWKTWSAKSSTCYHKK